MTKKKQPDLVRERLLAAAAALVLEKGQAGLTLDATARNAGVSKGGLIHHFASKAALLDALYNHVLEAFAQSWREAFDREPAGEARGTRAYVRLVALVQSRENQDLNRLSLLMSLDSAMGVRWRNMVDGQLRAFGEEPSHPGHWAARCTADGIWLESCAGTPLTAEERNALVACALTLVDDPQKDE